MIQYGPVMRPCQLINQSTVRKHGVLHGQSSTKFIEGLCRHLMRHPDPTIVPIFDYQYLGSYNGVYRYTYDMLRLGMLNSEEKMLVDGFRFMRANPRPRPTSDRYPMLIEFCNQIVDQYRYGDLHSSNVMVHPDGSYRVIDLEGYLNHPLDRPSNNWITTQ